MYGQKAGEINNGLFVEYGFPYKREVAVFEQLVHAEVKNVEQEMLDNGFVRRLPLMSNQQIRGEAILRATGLTLTELIFEAFKLGVASERANAEGNNEAANAISESLESFLIPSGTNSILAVMASLSEANQKALRLVLGMEETSNNHDVTDNSNPEVA